MKLLDAVFVVEIHDFGTNKYVFSAAFCTHWYTGTVFFVICCYFFFEWKNASRRNSILTCKQQSWYEKIGVKKRVCLCSWWSLTSQIYRRAYAFLIISQTRFGLGLFNEGGVGHQPLRLPAGRNPGPDGGNRRGRLECIGGGYTPPPVV